MYVQNAYHLKLISGLGKEILVLFLRCCTHLDMIFETLCGDILSRAS